MTRPKGERWRAFRARLPTVLAEAVSVVFAVLVALAVDEWWEDRENLELGRRGLEAIAAEVRTNLEGLERGGPEIALVMAHMDSVKALLDAGDQPESLSINYPVSLLSSAAWQTAQVTRAVHFVPIEEVTRIAGVYDFQAFFLRSQEQLTDAIGGILSGGEEPEAILRSIRPRYRTVASFRSTLAETYRCLLVFMDRGTPEEAAGCEDAETAGG